MVELAASDNPPTELEPFLGQLAKAGAIEFFVARGTAQGALFPISSREQTRGGDTFVAARSVRVLASWQIDWQSSGTPLRDALAKLVTELVGFDQIARFRFAASDMNLAAHAAAGLIEARGPHGHVASARVFERVIETGMVVTYARPFLENQPGLGRRWWPQDEDGRALHEELVDLRGEYHAHAEHTLHRTLEIMTGFTQSGRPILSEGWTQLPIHKLRILKDVAERQAERFMAEAERLDLELLGPVERPVPEVNEP
jgi:hypothetical protein